MSLCAFMSQTQLGLQNISPQEGILPQISSHFKPPNEVLNSSGTLLEEENETASSFQPVSPYLNRLDSTSEDGGRQLASTATGTPTEETAQSPPAFGNSLGVQGTAHGVQIPQLSISTFNPSANSGVQLRECVRLETGSGTPSLVHNLLNSSRDKFVQDSINQIENKNSSGPSLNQSGCLSPTNISSTSSGAPVFPSEPTILADKYIILGPVDASTSHAIQIRHHQPLHMKAVSPRTAREVCAQQALLGDCDGVRSPLEAVVAGCGKRAWLVFPPHYGDLHSYVRLRRRLREAEAQRLFSQVAATVEKCHASGLVLRDLKLRKFVFTDSNRQSVVLESVEDSVVAGESDLLHDKHGCPAYVAPEILSAAAYSGRHADMWGLGVILYTMLVGRYPFHNADTSTLFARIRSGKFFIPEWVSSRARHLILSLLRRQPHRRLSARQVLLHPWLNRSPRDHVGKDPQDHVVPTNELMTQHTLTSGKTRPP